MENVAQLAPLIIFIPAVGAIINFFVGKRLGERISSLVGITAAILAFCIAGLLFFGVSEAHGRGAVVNPAFLDTWIKIDSIGLNIPWQLRVDTLSVTMMLVVTGIGSLIHIYSVGYMHGDPKFSRFFAFLNLFLFFMLILVTGNNFLMMFVGWEGVGLCSFLLIGFWWDKSGAEGEEKANAAKKAFITNRIGDFGIIIATILIFLTFGTLNYYGPEEIANVAYVQEVAEEAHAEVEAVLADAHGEEVSTEETDEHGESTAVSEADSHDEEAQTDEEGHGEEAADDHGGEAAVIHTDNEHLEMDELGVFAQAVIMVEEGQVVRFGPFEVDITTMLVMIVLFMLLGVSGKSAQIPLFVWLPDAMAGPTPVSALIHAATMVTAGVYLMVRSSVFLDLAPAATFVIAIVGGATAVIAGFIAMGQWDIKRVLAYSTISQLGFMVAAVGVGAYVAAMFHLVTHAFFKAALFLGSGSVIHGVEHGHHHAHEHGHHDEHEGEFDPQDMRNMGGLRKKMPITFIAYIIATLALAGIPPLAGFWSKDEILAASLNVATHSGGLESLKGYMVLGLLFVGAFLTAFYMWRQIEMVFLGKPRTEAAKYAPESHWTMTLVLAILGILSIFGGFINVPTGAPIADGVYLAHEFEHWLEPTIVSVTQESPLFFQPVLALLASLVAIVAIFVARRFYRDGKGIVASDNDPLGTDVLNTLSSTKGLWSVANARMYWDEAYNMLFIRPYKVLAEFLAETVDWRFLHDYFHDSIIKRGYDAISRFLANPIDLGIVDGAVNGVGKVVRWSSGQARKLQTGYVRTYAVMLLLGAILVVVIMLIPLLQNGA